jgi:hypothetical protein
MYEGGDDRGVVENFEGPRERADGAVGRAPRAVEATLGVFVPDGNAGTDRMLARRQSPRLVGKGTIWLRSSSSERLQG